ncbi:hypothetical protein [Sediminitomix flava]|uniref:Uncharacterized protein n=1 Tax=Sediminitomix flava TaxID=379075 RepID=A0A315ZAM5_SEDFL|nr:hypothetical protein [Sediminitomix flava]PWJ42342.1 hypothetical protein BC781_103594 [Sediminitomix flava]
MKLIKYVWGLSLLLFLGFSLLMYVYLPEKVNLNIDLPSGEGVYLFRGDFFYTSMAVLLLFNIGLTIFGNAILYVPYNLIMIPNKKYWLSNVERKNQLIEKSKSWTKGMATFINIFLLATVTQIFSQNTEYNYAIDSVFYVIPIIIIFWIFYFFILFKAPATEQE